MFLFGVWFQLSDFSLFKICFVRYALRSMAGLAPDWVQMAGQSLALALLLLGGVVGLFGFTMFKGVCHRVTVFFFCVAFGTKKCLGS